MTLYDPTTVPVFSYSFSYDFNGSPMDYDTLNVTGYPSTYSGNPSYARVTSALVSWDRLTEHQSSEFRRIMDCIDEIMGWNEFAPEPEA